MFTLNHNALAFDVKAAHYGAQSRGIAPGGPSDALAFETARILLGLPTEYSCKEILYAKTIHFTQEVLFVLTGAHYERLELERNSTLQTLRGAEVFHAQPGDVVHLGRLYKGSKLYLMATVLTKNNEDRLGRKRGNYSDWFSPSREKIRVLLGPEADYLNAKVDFLLQDWMISPDSDLSGYRLLGERVPAKRYDIISSAVNDGTIQLTESGPIVLMRRRQTTGGYPRVFQVIAADLDHLAQYGVGAKLHFELIDKTRAKLMLQKKQAAIKRFAQAML